MRTRCRVTVAVLVLGLACVGPAVARAAEEPSPKVHPCAGAGRWFPADPAELRKAVEACTSGPTIPMARPPLVLVLPHAGYPFSAGVAGKAVATLKGRTYRRVLLFGCSHQAPVRGASVLRVDAYETPLGRIPVDAEARDALLKCPVVSEQPAAHKNEHSVENELPLLQGVLKDFRMVEVLVGDMTSDERATLADAVRGLVGEGALLVVSSDFTHYGPNYGYVPFKDRVPENLRALNDMGLQELSQVDVPGWDAHIARTRDTVCGAKAIGLALKVLEPWDDVQAVRAAFDTSGRMTGDYTNSVTYASLVFWRMGEGLADAEQKTLLRLARDAVAHFLETGKALVPDEKKYDLSAALKAPGAAFVTLKNQGRLRGCIGHIVAVMPLYASIIENACQACRDPRFTAEPVTAKEVPELRIEISVLAPMRRLLDPKTVQVGRDGLMMVRGRNRGLLLPQVPGEQGWDREAFLAGTCRKAGLPLDAWKDPETEIYRFSAQVFGEPEAAGAKKE